MRRVFYRGDAESRRNARRKTLKGSTIYVLHVFAKKTRKASLLDVELGKKRYRELLERRK